jgi:hypothetical protein
MVVADGELLRRDSAHATLGDSSPLTEKIYEVSADLDPLRHK